MKIDESLQKQIVTTLEKEIPQGKKSGVIETYNLSYYLDAKPKFEILSFPLNILFEGRNEVVYIGGQLES